MIHMNKSSMHTSKLFKYISLVPLNIQIMEFIDKGKEEQDTKVPST